MTKFIKQKNDMKYYSKPFTEQQKKMNRYISRSGFIILFLT